ncbi:hypothetical protein [Saccharopolyspora sp. CA-218241]|uniref:hypothetical protein n=1 Tax=Saccharopolyspora sp. CA-218241 TaxID=3240027 RepID=UPI003D9968FA
MTTISTGPWTDASGTVHIRVRGPRTLCGMPSAYSPAARPREACTACVTASIADYARHHACGPGCHG